MVLFERMQIRRSSFEGDRPECPGDCPECHGRAKLHRHASYERYRSAEGQEREKVQRYICTRCAHTFSVVEDLLPYRALGATVLEEHLEGREPQGLSPPKAGIKVQEALSRAVGVMIQRAEVLRAAAGLIVRSSTPSTATLWQKLKGAFGNLEEILLFLARKINASLLGDYVCLRGWWTLQCGIIAVTARQNG